ncbi:MAG: hypothetical protein WCB19_09105 [Thermoplasmata archaeon]
MSTCPKCGVELGPGPWTACPECGTLLPAAAASAPGTPVPQGRTAVTCPNCKTAMSAAGELQFRVGGSTGGPGFLLGNWNQLSEQLQPFSVYHCPTCGRVDLYEPGK